jgi:hypothetical protein
VNARMNKTQPLELEKLRFKKLRIRGHVTNVQYKSSKNCHYESPSPHNEYNSNKNKKKKLRIRERKCCVQNPLDSW